LLIFKTKEMKNIYTSIAVLLVSAQLSVQSITGTWKRTGNMLEDIYGKKADLQKIMLHSSSSFARYFAIDFKNWRFFTWQERLSTVTPHAQFAGYWGDYKSLDRLLKWPAGWGKK
jgi:hypothetical protein